MLTKYRPFYRMFLCLYLLLPALAAIVAIANLASIPSDSQNAVLLGMSRSRLLIAGILVLAATSFLFLSIQVLRQPENTIRWIERKLASHRLLVFSTLGSAFLFFVTATFLAIPDKYLGEFWAIEERLRPLVIWLLLVSIQVLAGLIGWQIRKNRKAVNTAKSMFIPGGISLGLLLAAWGFIALTHLGISGGNSYWSKVGVPILWPQIFLALAVAFGVRYVLIRFFKDQSKRILLDLVLSILIGLNAVVLWNNQSYMPGVFNTQPRPPTNEIYPINDSLIFDLAAQKMLIGQKMMADAWDKPMYIAYLATLHWLAGSSFNSFYLLQIITYALIPVLGYFIGKSLHSRPLGFMFAIILILKEQNAIALTNYIHVSTSKLILSETLTSLGVLLFTLLLINWLKNPSKANPSLWLAGGVLGLTSLVRLNSIGILPVIILLIGLAVNFKWKPWITASVMISVFLIISATPWLARNFAMSSSPFAFINSKTSGVIVNQRYNPIIEQNTQPKSGPGPSQSNRSRLDSYFTIGQGIVTNYLHNLIGITVMLPPSFELYKLLDEVRLPYWKTEWGGSLLPGAFWIIAGTLGIIALGIASAWKRWRVAGLAPLAVILGYNITTAISLTSGGRYLVPMDWCVLLYFSIGLFDVVVWLLSLFGIQQNNEPIRFSATERVTLKNPSIFIAGLAFLFVGALPIFWENLPAQRYPTSVNVDDFIEKFKFLPEISNPQTIESITSFSKDPAAKVLYGRALYPRFFGENKGDGASLDQDPLIGSAGFDRLSFFLAGGTTDSVIIIPTSARISPNVVNADTWVIGCQRDKYIEAMIVVFRARDIRVYEQEPLKAGCQ